jgi:triosephosphate isomerase
VQHIFVNLKRFDVARALGGLCDFDSPEGWIEWVIEESVGYGLGSMESVKLTFLLPEALIGPAVRKLTAYPAQLTQGIEIGCQGVYRENIKPGGNFGAFTTNRPAAAAKTLGSKWAIIGHSEERKDKLGIIEEFIKECPGFTTPPKAASDAVSRLISREVVAALEAGLDTLVCIGESAQERGEGSFEEQQGRIKEVLARQLELSLDGVRNWIGERQVVIGYEPIWAIGPGKTPPGPEYIAFVSAFIQETVRKLFAFTPVVVYGGGLKEENAKMICSIGSIGGGLVALTKFTGQVGFYPADLKKIVDECIGGRR